jgi:hypothetical protein
MLDTIHFLAYSLQGVFLWFKVRNSLTAEHPASTEEILFGSNQFSIGLKLVHLHKLKVEVPSKILKICLLIKTVKMNLEISF